MDINLVDELRSLIGAPPAGMEFIEYIFLGFLLIFLVSSICSILCMVFKWLGGGR